MKQVAVIVLNFNGGDDTLSCLSSLKKVTHKNFDIVYIVVDNASSDNSLEKIENEFSDVVLLKNQENLGFSGGNNIGIVYALEKKSDYVVILNNDTVVQKDFLEQLVETAEREKESGIISPKIYFEKGFEYHKDKYEKNDLGSVIWYGGGKMDWQNLIGSHRGVDEVDKGQYDRVEKTDFATGCCMLIKKEVLEKVGLFDERYFLYYEDSDLSERTKKNGFTILYCPQAVIWHKNAQSAGKSGSRLQDYYITRNRLLFASLYAPFRTKLSLIKESLRLLLSGREYQKKGIRDFYKKKFGKAEYLFT